MYVNHATFLSNKINIRYILIFQNGKYFCHKFYHATKPMSRAENMIKHKIKRETSSQRLPVS